MEDAKMLFFNSTVALSTKILELLAQIKSIIDLLNWCSLHCHYHNINYS